MSNISVTIHCRGRNYHYSPEPSVNPISREAKWYAVASEIHIFKPWQILERRRWKNAMEFNTLIQIHKRSPARFLWISDEIAFRWPKGAHQAKAGSPPLDLAISTCFSPRWNRSCCTLICQAAATLHTACPPRTFGGFPSSEPRRTKRADNILFP